MSDQKKSDPLATNIADDVIAQALKSVERHTKPAANEVEVAVEPIAESESDEAAAEPSATAASADAQAEEIARLKADLLEARQALRQREAELEASQSMSRGTMEKLREGHERLLRATADLENYKKRVAREREETAKFGQEKLLRDLLPVVDNLDRALEHANTPADFEGLKTGIQMTRKLFESTLGKHGVKGFSSLDQPFDPNLHEAMQAVESDAAPGTVVQEMVRGYTLHERLMRPAMVVVAKARTAPAASPAETATETAPTDPASAEAAPAEKAASGSEPEGGGEPAANS